MNAHDVMLTKGIAYRKTVRQLELALKDHGITVAEWLCLGAVGSGIYGGGELAGILGVTKGMASRQLGELQSRQLVQEIIDKKDARARTYGLTKLGKQLLEASDVSATTSMKQWLSSVEPAEIHIYIRVLALVAKL